MPLILLVGQDLRLLATRAAVLAQLDSTIKWGTPSMIETVPRWEHVDLLLLCHTLPREQREELVSVFREKSPETEILQLVSTIEVQDIDLLPRVKIGICDPASLVRRVEELMGASARSKPPGGATPARGKLLNPEWLNGNLDSIGTSERSSHGR